MKFSTSVVGAILVACTSASALPAKLQARALPDDPSPVPVDVLDLDHDISVTCGDKKYGYDDIYKAIQWGILLQDKGIGRGKKSKEYPNGRFPHDYQEDKFDFGGECPAGDDARQEYPLVANGPYNGGLRNDKWGDDRVIFFHEPGEVSDVQSNPVGHFCGVITHSGAPSQAEFVECT